MTAYMVVQHSDDPRLSAYRAAAAEANEAVGARVVSIGASAFAIEGAWDYDRMTVVEFPDMATARDFYASADYARIKDLRAGLPAMTIVLVDGAQ